MDLQKLNINIKLFISKNKILFNIFIITTLFFIFQHAIILSWDFCAYVLNAKYLFYNGNYFESLRPPLAPLILAPFILFGKIGEYLYIIVVSSLFLYSSIKLSDTVFVKYKKDKKYIRLIFYLLLLTPYALTYGVKEGTEILSLSLFEIFLAYLLKGKTSGHYLALAFLSRYSFLFFSPLMLLNKNYKKIIKNFLLFFVIISPWLIFNFFKYGNWLASIVDSYANNIFFRDYLYQPLNYLDILKTINWLIPLFVFGLILSIISIINWKKSKKENLIHLFFIILILLIIYDYNNIPLKQIRYLFNLILPVAYFSTLGLYYIIKKVKKIKLFLYILVIFFFIQGLILCLNIYYNENQKIYYGVADDINKLEINSCEILSPHWVYMNYLSSNVYPLGNKNISKSINAGKIILIFKNKSTIDDSYTEEELKINPILYENEDYIFLGYKKNCSKKYIKDSPYVSDHCYIISQKLNFTNSYEICRYLNFNKNEK